MVSWALINTFGLPLGLWLYRNGFAYYHSVRTAYKQQKSLVRPLPLNTLLVLNVLFGFAVLALLSTFPTFTPSNIFAEAKARLQINNDTLFARLASLRPLTPLDNALRSKIATEPARLMYFLYGPSVLAGCTFCEPKEPYSYLIYAAPVLALPHLLHVAVLGGVTSSLLAGPDAARWRTQATIAGVALAAADLYLHLTYDHSHNILATRPGALDFFFWRMRIYRGLAIAFVDALLGWVIWLSATNRFFMQPPGTIDRLDALARAMEAANFRLAATGNVRNAVVRDRALLGRTENYWTFEKNVYEEREVVDATRAALARINMQQLTDMAKARVGDMLNASQPPAPPG